MAGINYPLWHTLKANIETILLAVAVEENTVDTARNFLVVKDRWRPWIEAQQKVPLVNIMVQTVGTNADRSGSRRNTLNDVTVIIDMYALGEAGNVLPADALAADRLDLLVAQVREGLTRLKESDFSFPQDVDGGHVIDVGNKDFTLTYFDQENEQSAGQYAPARWTFIVQMPFIPTDNNIDTALTELNVSVLDETLEQYALKFTYE